MYTATLPDPEVLLAATKFLHLAFVVPNEEFNLYSLFRSRLLISRYCSHSLVLVLVLILILILILMLMLMLMLITIYTLNLRLDSNGYL